MTRMFANFIGFNTALRHDQPMAGGLLLPGGSFSNLLSIMTARNFFFPQFAQAS
jgi:hypothetical protein